MGFQTKIQILLVTILCAALNVSASGFREFSSDAVEAVDAVSNCSAELGQIQKSGARVTKIVAISPRTVPNVEVTGYMITTAVGGLAPSFQPSRGPTLVAARTTKSEPNAAPDRPGTVTWSCQVIEPK